MQLARLAGARVVGTVSNESKAAAVGELGGEPLFYGDDLLPRLLAGTGGRGFDVVLDSVGRETQELSLAALAPYGHLIHYGEASGPPRPVAPDRLYERCLKVSAFGLNLNERPGDWHTARGELLRLVSEGALKLTVSRVLPLEVAAEAHRLLESRAVTGKMLLKVA